jgi:HD-GYP domain-containing protein (c-di-GMP phosphodiesterase class II)
MTLDSGPAREVITALDADPAPLSRLAPSIVRRDVDQLAADQVREAPTLVVLTRGLVEADPEGEALASLPSHAVVVSCGDTAGRLATRVGRLFARLEDASGAEAEARLLTAGLDHSGALLAASRAARLRAQLGELNAIGMALMSERDPDQLLSLILTQARKVTQSDAGSLYLVEEDDAGTEMLRFRLSQNDTLPDLPNPDFRLPIDTSSTAGYAAATREPLVLEDVYDLPAGSPFSFNAGFDREHGYRAKSQLVVPMLDHQDRVVGVLQLINRKRDPEAAIRDEASATEFVLPYEETQVETVQSLAGQAAISIENGQLYQAIENLFEGFIKAAVTAIDQRDPTTSGHSVRVTELTCELAEVVHAHLDGPYADVSFSREEMKQLRYAGLLHDFGKVGVRESVLVKQKKLPPEMWERLIARFDLCRTTLRAAHQRDRLALVEDGSAGAEAFEALDTALASEMEKLEAFEQAVRDANEPRVLPEEGAAILDEILDFAVEDLDGETLKLMSEDELHYLRIRRGSLDQDEIKQIQSHVVHSYNFLQEIPWTPELARIDEIVRGHHEKLDGTGYPDGVAAEDIPVETRMMTVADIFDALTASDRPYKRAMPVERALSILQMEAEGGQLDPEMVRLFVESEVYKKVLEKDWREF